MKEYKLIKPRIITRAVALGVSLSCCLTTLPMPIWAQEEGDGHPQADQYTDEQKEEILDMAQANRTDMIIQEPFLETAETRAADLFRPSQYRLNGIDISNHQSTIDLDKIQADFVLVKASGGDYFQDRSFRKFADKTLEQGRLLGFYHFARDWPSQASGSVEARFFYEQTKDYIGKGIPVLDYEEKSLLASGTEWAREFVETYYQLSGVKCMIYTGGWAARALDWSSLANEGYPLWVAMYGTNPEWKGYAANPTTFGSSMGAFENYVMHQYSSKGKLDGYSGYLDLNKFYGSAADWMQMARSDFGRVVMYRLYNPNSGEHFYTRDTNEQSSLIQAGWKDENTAWTAPENGAPVYRLYNPNAGDHHYTLDLNERQSLIAVGWNDEGIGWYSAPESGQPVYRVYNPNAVAGAHHFTTDFQEIQALVSVGWKDEGIAWYGLFN